MVELLLNGKPVQFKIDTGAARCNCNFRRNILETGWSQFKKKSESLHGPVKQAPANNEWTIH